MSKGAPVDHRPASVVTAAPLDNCGPTPATLQAWRGWRQLHPGWHNWTRRIAAGCVRAAAAGGLALTPASTARVAATAPPIAAAPALQALDVGQPMPTARAWPGSPAGPAVRGMLSATALYDGRAALFAGPEMPDARDNAGGEPQPVPEPSTVLLLAASVALLARFRARRRR